MKPMPDGWQTNPTGRVGWDWALYPVRAERVVGADLFQSLITEYEDVRVECRGGRLRILVEVDDAD